MAKYLVPLFNTVGVVVCMKCFFLKITEMSMFEYKTIRAFKLVKFSQKCTDDFFSVAAFTGTMF